MKGWQDEHPLSRNIHSQITKPSNSSDTVDFYILSGFRCIDVTLLKDLRILYEYGGAMY